MIGFAFLLSLTLSADPTFTCAEALELKTEADENLIKLDKIVHWQIYLADCATEFGLEFSERVELDRRFHFYGRRFIKIVEGAEYQGWKYLQEGLVFHVDELDKNFKIHTYDVDLIGRRATVVGSLQNTFERDTISEGTLLFNGTALSATRREDDTVSLLFPGRSAIAMQRAIVAALPDTFVSAKILPNFIILNLHHKKSYAMSLNGEPINGKNLSRFRSAINRVKKKTGVRVTKGEKLDDGRYETILTTEDGRNIVIKPDAQLAEDSEGALTVDIENIIYGAVSVWSTRSFEVALSENADEEPFFGLSSESPAKIEEWGRPYSEQRIFSNSWAYLALSTLYRLHKDIEWQGAVLGDIRARCFN